MKADDDQSELELAADALQQETKEDRIARLVRPFQDAGLGTPDQVFDLTDLGADGMTVAETVARPADWPGTEELEPPLEIPPYGERSVRARIVPVQSESPLVFESHFFEFTEPQDDFLPGPSLAVGREPDMVDSCGRPLGAAPPAVDVESAPDPGSPEEKP